jgi:V/A-type H+-transporting ATPase subunit G/H
MHHNIIKDTINLDKKAREEVSEIVKKKEHLDELIKVESEKLHQSFIDEIKEKIKLTEEKYEFEMAEKKKSELLNYKETLKAIQKQYEENKELWIEEIFNACIK